MSEKRVYKNRPPLGAIVYYYPMCVETTEPEVGIIVKSFPSGCARISILKGDANGSKLIMTAYHKSDDMLYDGLGRITPRAKNGCWDFLPWERIFTGQKKRRSMTRSLAHKKPGTLNNCEGDSWKRSQVAGLSLA